MENKVKDQMVTENYAIYNSDCMLVLPTLETESIDLSVYSPPFAGLYNYSSSENDFSNCENKEQFLDQYEFLIKEIARVTKKGRITAVHCTDVFDNTCRLWDFPNEIIRLHTKYGFEYRNRITIWKEPLKVRMRTMVQSLMHKFIVEDSTKCFTAMPDYVLIFTKKGDNEIPVTHQFGINHYAGEIPILPNILRAWNDIRIDNVLPFRDSREEDDEKHVHPLQLDVIDRIVELYSNPNEVVLTPFMGVGSEVYSPVSMGRKAIGIELKDSYFKQAKINLSLVDKRFIKQAKQSDIFETESEM